MSGTTEKGNPAAEIPAAEAAPASAASGEARADDEVVVEVEAPATGPGAGVEVTADPLAAEVASLQARLDLSQGMARATMEKLREEHERFLRATADLDNYKKRAAREKDDLQKFAAEKLVKDLLPAVDNLERALAAAPPGDALSGGVRMVLKLLEAALSRHGVEPQSALGQPFDPSRHEALMKVETAEHPPGLVLSEHGRAWLLRGRLLRPAMVAVAAAPAGAEVAPAGRPGGTGPG